MPKSSYCDISLPTRPPVQVVDEETVKSCRRCGAQFVTRTRARKRCAPCQQIVGKARQAKTNERAKAKRKAAKARRILP
jgi:hypothetical protein